MENYTHRICGCQKTGNCYNIILAVIGALLAFAIGIIVGLSAFETLTTYFTAIVSIAILLAVLFVVFLILRFCTVNRNC